MLNILIVEDNSNIRKLYRSYLERAGFLVLEAIDGQDALNVLEHNTVNLMISTKDCLDDKKQGFKFSSDDFIVKPIECDDMILRVEALRYDS